MADNIDFSAETEEELIKKQKCETKELQAKIQKLKHGVPKGDKKRKKEVSAEIEKLESDLNKKHKDELEEFRSKDVTSSATVEDDNIVEEIENLKIDEDEGTDAVQKKKKKGKAKRRKERKQEEESARQERIDSYENDNQFSNRNIEALALKKILDERDLMIHDIPSDGNCLYAAIVHQLQRQGIESSITSLRHQTALIMRTNSDEYRPFLTHSHSGLPLSDEQYEVYLSELETTPAWGGQVEIRAISTYLQHPIEVVQADGPCIHTGEEYDKLPLILSYHRHIYGLGEHFNSVVPRVIQEDEFTTVT